MPRPHWLLLLAVLSFAAPAARPATRSWSFLTTGNGHGFQVFDRDQHKLTYFFENPYRYVAPTDATRTSGIGRRNMLHDAYFGVRVGTVATWLDGQTQVGYEAESNVIHASSSQNGVRTDTYYFGPFGYEGNALVMLVHATNEGSGPVDVALFAKPNFKLGSGRTDPGEESEQIASATAGGLAYVTETGPGGGHVVYLPIGGADHAACGTDGALYSTVGGGGSLVDQATCNGSGIVNVYEKDARLAAGDSVWWGMAALFVNDTVPIPAIVEERTVGDVVAAWQHFVGTRDAQQVHDDALAEWEQWRSDKMPSALSAAERAVWRQSEAVLRMGQIREPRNSHRANYGMFLASLPVGEWHTGWVRDGTYAIMAMAALGHDAEAKMGIEFFLGAEWEHARSGFFSSANYLANPYRVSVCRYFGNGLEEGDFNQDGPNIETDGWGLVLWASRMVLEHGCDRAWLDRKTRYNDTVFEALHGIAQDIEEHIQSDMPAADASIWEVHWMRRQVFAYTVAAQARGLYDFAAICALHGDTDLATHYRGLADAMRAALRTRLVYAATSSLASNLNVAGNPVHVDGSTVEALSWDLVQPGESLWTGTMNEYSRLLTTVGGYRRVEPNLDLTGSGGANEYDLSEWVLLDLRISDAWRRGGNTSLADQLLDKVTTNAGANDNLVPELYDPQTGRYAGVVPMVGYGAGAWVVTQLHKHGAPDPDLDATLAHCNTPPPVEPVADSGGGADVAGPHDAARADVAGGRDLVTRDEPSAPFDAGDGVGPGPGPTGDDTVAGDAAVASGTWHDSKAALCAVSGFTGGGDPRGVGALLLLALGALLALKRGRLEPQRRRGAEPARSRFMDALCASAPLRLKLGVCFAAALSLLLLALPARAQELGTPDSSPKWEVDFHGYSRMPLRWHGSPAAPRPPYLVDDDYYLSGFAYTRVQETDWTEAFLGVRHGNTYFRLGFFTNQFSDWTDSFKGQWGIAQASVEHEWEPLATLRVGIKGGMFWESFGHILPYDTYLFGRTHQAGVELWTRFETKGFRGMVKAGFGAHADVINLNQGFTPLAYMVLGAGYSIVDATFYLLKAWTRDSKRQYSVVQNGDLLVFGGDASIAIPYTGPIYLGLAYYKADKVLFLANAFELLHCTGGTGLTQNFFGSDSKNGTGEILAAAMDYPIRVFGGASLRVFGMLAWVLSEQHTSDPLTNKSDRVYFKWGLEPRWRPPWKPFDMFFVSLRYDRVILDTKHDSMSFRVLTPTVGVTPVANLDIFFAYSHYWYGARVTLRPNQIPGDLAVTAPDEDVFKLQAQIAW